MALVLRIDRYDCLFCRLQESFNGHFRDQLARSEKMTERECFSFNLRLQRNLIIAYNKNLTSDIHVSGFLVYNGSVEARAGCGF